ncbi:hypothetical protein ACFPMF_07090 [Larkinella bovis]|uniref:Uncharacterized protein n=1 Tax=Larkinella bovis TaxID=683041 RepID=A0ABW0I718_9BACT
MKKRESLPAFSAFSQFNQPTFLFRFLVAFFDHRLVLPSTTVVVAVDIAGFFYAMAAGHTAASPNVFII